MPGKSHYSLQTGERDFCFELSDDESANAIRCDVKDQAAVQAANPGRIVIGVSKSFIEVQPRIEK